MTSWKHLAPIFISSRMLFKESSTQVDWRQIDPLRESTVLPDLELVQALAIMRFVCSLPSS